MQKLPRGSKLVSRQLLLGENFRVEMADKLELESWLDKGAEGPGQDQKAMMDLCRYGILSEPHEFVQRVLKAGHPKDLMGQVSQLSQDTISSNFHRPPHLWAKERFDSFKKYSALAMELKAEELKLRYQMPDHTKKLTKGKRLALWGRMLSDVNYPDTELINDMERGFPLSGWMPTSGVLPNGVRQPTVTVEELLGSLESFNSKVKQQMDMRQDATLEKDTWDETVKELDKGWIWLDPCQDWDGKCVARRFGIHQGGKTRV